MTSLQETKALSDIAELLYRFLPGNPHPFASADISFPGVAKKVGLSEFWIGGSKKPAIITLLQQTLDFRRDRFCNLVLQIVNTGMVYLSNKREPVTREEIEKLNQLILQVKLKIPELWTTAFLDALPSTHPIENPKESGTNQETIEKLKNKLIELANLNPQQRGFDFEKFLNELFAAYNLKPRSSFRLLGEQIDGSFQLGLDTYLVEAKWQDSQIGQSDLLVFSGKVTGKSTWSRGLLVSYSGFTKDGLTAFAHGRATNIIGMDSLDLFHILNGELPLHEAIIEKARRAAESGEFFVPVYTISHGG
jgi:restriction endonuclease Mrr